MPTTRHDRPGPDPVRIRRRLLAWFDANRRDLPWRRSAEPYRVWVSEVMLQQTQVDRVVAYFDRFLERFPDVQALASATLEDVLKVWEGLGYYGRARSLHRAARVVVDSHEGALPSSAKELARLPGFGRYTAAAVASIAFGECVPAVDTNVHRVVARLARIDGAPLDSASRIAVESVARALVRGRRPGDVNQALMDLGAAICRPRVPRCEACPLIGVCGAGASGDPERWPGRRPKPARAAIREVRALIVRRSRILVVRRAEEGLLGGMWELPGAEVAPHSGDVETMAALRDHVSGQTGLDIAPGAAIASFRFVFSHLELDVTVVQAVVTGGRLQRGAGRWVTPADCAALPLTRAARRALASFENI